MARDGPDSSPENGLKAVFMQTRGDLMRFLRARGAGASAEDLVQELWMKVETTHIGPVADPRSYLFRMADNLMLDRRRSEMRQQRRNALWVEISGTYDNQASAAPLPDRILLGQEQLRQVDHALDTLGPRAAATFRRFRLGGTRQAQIARDLGVSIATVEKDLQKAYRLLARLREAQNTDLDAPQRLDHEGEQP